jgi:DNA polymerase III epsilon subunit-like protein
MKHLFGNTIASVDVETTGTLPRYHEIIQVAIVLLDSTLRPDGRSFSTYIRPEHPERIDAKAFAVNGLSLEMLEEAPDAVRAADLFDEWFVSLPLPVGGKLIPLAHNYVFEHGFLTAWLGEAGRDHHFHYHARDAQFLALSIKDQMALRGQKAPFESVSLTNLCKVYKVVNEKAHDALADALAEAELYRKMLCGNA